MRHATPASGESGRGRFHAERRLPPPALLPARSGSGCRPTGRNRRRSDRPRRRGRRRASAPLQRPHSFPEHHGRAHGSRHWHSRLQLQPALTRCRGVLHFVGFSKRGEKPLRLFDLRKLRRRRKSCQRGREHRVSVDGAVGRLIELRQRQRRAQLEAACLLLFAMAMAARKASSAGAVFVGSRLAESRRAPDALRQRTSVAGLPDRRELLLHGCQSGAQFARCSLRFGEQGAEKRLLDAKSISRSSASAARISTSAADCASVKPRPE